MVQKAVIYSHISNLTFRLILLQVQAVGLLFSVGHGSVIPVWYRSHPVNLKIIIT